MIIENEEEYERAIKWLDAIFDGKVEADSNKLHELFDAVFEYEKENKDE